MGQGDVVKFVRKTKAVLREIFTPTTRRWIYGVSTASVPLLVLQDSTAAKILAVINAMFVSTVAAVNVKETANA